MSVDVGYPPRNHQFHPTTTPRRSRATPLTVIWNSSVQSSLKGISLHTESGRRWNKEASRSAAPAARNARAVARPIRAGRPISRRAMTTSSVAAANARPYHGFRHPCSAPACAAHLDVVRKLIHASARASAIDAMGAQAGTRSARAAVEAMAFRLLRDGARDVGDVGADGQARREPGRLDAGGVHQPRLPAIGPDQ